MLGLGTLRRVIKEVSADVSYARERDPADRVIGTLEILTGWAGVQALLAHRVAHALWEAEVPLVPRTIAYTSRSVTGVEIHPAARIGSDFFIRSASSHQPPTEERPRTLGLRFTGAAVRHEARRRAAAAGDEIIEPAKNGGRS